MDKFSEAFKAACDARNFAYAPYSNFLVGAALKVKGHDSLFTGCNVENAGFSATICAERNAVFSSFASVGKQTGEFMVLVTDTTPPASPCGSCLQVLAEFYHPEFCVYLANLQGIQEKVLLKDLIPRIFTLK